MKNKRFLFIGNRPKVLDYMIRQSLNVVKIFALPDSYLSTYCKQQGLAFTEIPDRKTMLGLLAETEFDVLVSNGLPFIVPVSDLKKSDQLFVNVHPSYLPDLKGMHPCNGAFLFNKFDTGASCHLMDDGVDTGGIIARSRINMTTDLDLGMLYQLSFLAEVEAFAEALKVEFKPARPQPTMAVGEPTYYTRKKGDNVIDFGVDSYQQIIQKVKAFGIEGQYAYFETSVGGGEVLSAEPVHNSFLNRFNNYCVANNLPSHQNRQVVLSYGNNVVIKLPEGYMKLRLSRPLAEGAIV